MVDISNITKVNELVHERRGAERAVSMLEAGAKITGFAFGGSRMAFNIDADYPQQMVDSIKSILQARISAIDNELASLGVSMTEPAAAAKTAATNKN